MTTQLIDISQRVVKLTLRYGPSSAIHFLKSYLRLKKEIGAKINDIVKKHRVENPGAAFQKYLALHYWLFIALERVFQLGLHESTTKRILDLGTGAGYFPYACRYFGHDVEALDVPDNAMYNEIIEKLHIKRHTQYIEKFRDIDIGGKFDLVTAFMICFNNHKKADVWHDDEWAYFLSSVSKHQLLDDGVIFLSLNAESEDVPIHPELIEYFRIAGAKIHGLEILMKKSAIAAER